MDRRNRPPAAFWGESLGFWCRLWQIQFEHSLRVLGALAAQAPRPSSVDLAAEAEGAARVARAAQGLRRRNGAPRPDPRKARIKPARRNGGAPQLRQA
ncbi:MAG TPA: hypothetical protein GX700_00425 [Paracoccus sp.]|nr:hypothetical protein [Paracoccus sp. (in: a-proteobacteria)]